LNDAGGLGDDVPVDASRILAPDVAVITVVRNAERTLERTIRSVLEQTHPSIDYLVMDGRSTDGTIPILRRYQGSVRWISEPDRGLYDAMNKGLGLLMSPDSYVIFLNADDVFHAPDTVASVLAASRGEDFLYGRLERRDEALGTTDVIGGPITARDLRFSMRCHHQAIFCRRRVFDAIGAFNLEYRVAADYDWVIRVFQDDSIAKRFVPVVISTMTLGGVSDRSYLHGVWERRRIVRRRYSTLDFIRFRVYSVFGDYLRFYLQRFLRRAGLLRAARSLKAAARRARSSRSAPSSSPPTSDS
jgi:glycosyltransferase involved in cell wall biosynthesis